MIKYFPSIHGLDVCVSAGVGNLNNENELLSYLKKCSSLITEFMIDSGVHKLFHKKGLKDYSRSYVIKYYNMISYIAKIFKNINFYAVIPDVPSDYDNNPIPDNVSKTISWIQDYLKHEYLYPLDNVTVIAVVQGRKDSVSNVINNYLKYREIYSNFSMLGLGPTCTTRNVNTLAKLILSFDKIVDRPYHVFGPNIKAIRKVIKEVRKMYSFDSSGFFRYSDDGSLCVRNNRGLCLLKFIKKLKEISVCTPNVYMR